ncbi:helix-turn-helix domain-containing protein [Pseudonocardia saturnea]
MIKHQSARPLNCRTTVYARKLMVWRHQAGWPHARIAEQLGVSRPTVSGNWKAVCLGLRIRRRFTKPGCPWTNGEAERLNRTRLTPVAVRHRPPRHPGRMGTPLHHPTRPLRRERPSQIRTSSGAPPPSAPDPRRPRPGRRGGRS